MYRLKCTWWLIIKHRGVIPSSVCIPCKKNKVLLSILQYTGFVFGSDYFISTLKMIFNLGCWFSIEENGLKGKEWGQTLVWSTAPDNLVDRASDYKVLLFISWVVLSLFLKSRYIWCHKKQTLEVTCYLLSVVTLLNKGRWSSS